MSNINFNAVYGLISKLISIIGPALKSVKDLDAELAALKKTADASEAELKQVYYDSYDMAHHKRQHKKNNTGDYVPHK